MNTEKLLELLICPECKGAVTMLGSREGLVCRSCDVVYPVREGIPVMLISEAVRIDESSAGTG